MHPVVAYAAALLVRAAGVPMEWALLLAPLAAAAGALLYGWFCVRLSGVYLAMAGTMVETKKSGQTVMKDVIFLNLVVENRSFGRREAGYDHHDEYRRGCSGRGSASRRSSSQEVVSGNRSDLFAIRTSNARQYRCGSQSCS